MNDDILWKIDSEIEKDKRVVMLENQIENLELEHKIAKERIHDLLKDNTEYKLANERLHNIIKEVREYAKEHIRIDDEYPDYMEMLIEEYDKLLEILDKEGKDNG